MSLRVLGGEGQDRCEGRCGQGQAGPAAEPALPARSKGH